MLKIEVLYSEVANLFGDVANIRYLEKSIPDCEVVYTTLQEKPAFTDPEAGIDLLYMGPMPEFVQELAIKALLPYRDELKAYIESGRVGLFTGNAWEVLGQYIEKDDGSRIQALGLHPGHAVRRMMQRYNSLYLGRLALPADPAAQSSLAYQTGLKEDGSPLDIIGFKSQFSQTVGVPGSLRAFRTVRECDAEHTGTDEGVRMGNFFGTYLLGPFLIVDIPFTKYLFGLLGFPDTKPAFEEDAMYCYEKRMEDFLDPTKDFH